MNEEMLIEESEVEREENSSSSDVMATAPATLTRHQQIGHKLPVILISGPSLTLMGILGSGAVSTQNGLFAAMFIGLT